MTLSLRRELFDKSLGVAQILRGKTFGEPVVRRDEHLVSFSSHALCLPETGQVLGCSQFQRLRALALGDLDGTAEAGLRFGFIALHYQ